MLQPYLIEGRIEAGCDEAGRGCLAGPVTAAAVILPAGFASQLINDSKQLTEHQREQLRPVIEHEALAWAVAHVSPQEIDRINILNASILAKTHRDELMRRVAQDYPGYGWEANKGYPTREHRDAIRRLGITPLHRHSFALLPQPTLFDI